MKHKLKMTIAIGGSILVLALALLVVANRANRPDSELPKFANPTGTLPDDRKALSVIRPFSPEVAWNRPVTDFGRSVKYDQYAERFWKYGGYGGWEDPSLRGLLYLEMRNYAVPIYDARLATGTKRAYFAGFGYPPSPGFSVEVPWNDSWKPAPGNDAQMLIMNPDTGEQWTIWLYMVNNPSTCLGLANLASGFTPFTDLCVGGAGKLANEDGTDGDYRTWNSTLVERGMGLPKLALVTTPYEVQQGKIEHALEMTVFNSMFGPPCSDAEVDTPAAGSTCGFYLPPATRVEWAEGPVTGCGENNQPDTPAVREKTVPHGMRFALDITDDDIEAWLDERGYADPLRTTARVFAVALRDYGWMVAETGCYGTSIEVDGMINPDAAKIWKSLGVEDNPKAGEMLYGLVTEDNIYVVNPPEPVTSSKPPSPGRNE